jgi:hypothetical protein
MVAGEAESVQTGDGGGALTTISSSQVTDPPAPVAVRVYTVVVAGDVVADPPRGSTEPMPWLRETEVAFAVTQESVEVSPTMMVAGEALKSQVGARGDGGSATVTVALQVYEPPGPEAVPVYVFVAEGETAVEPPGTGVMRPMP